MQIAFKTFATEASFGHPSEYALIEKVEKAVGSSFYFTQLADAICKRHPMDLGTVYSQYQAKGNMGSYETYELLQELRRQKGSGWPNITDHKLWRALTSLASAPEQWRKDLVYETRIILSQPAKYNPMLYELSDWLDLNDKLGHDASQLSPSWLSHEDDFNYNYLRLPQSWDHGSPQETYSRYMYLKKHVLDKTPLFQNTYHSLSNWVNRQTDINKGIWAFEQRKTILKDYIQALWTNTSEYTSRTTQTVQQACKMLFPEMASKLNDLKSTLEALGYNEIEETLLSKLSHYNISSYTGLKYTRKCVERDYALYAPLILEGNVTELNIDNSIFDNDYSD